MEGLGELAHVAVRQVASDTPACSSSNDYNGRLGIRVSAIFVILVGSLFGTSSKGINWMALTIS